MRKKIAISAVSAIAMLVVIVAAWAATDFRRDIGTLDHCPCKGDLLVAGVPIQGEGGIEAVTVGNSDDDDPIAQTILEVSSFHHSQDHPELGPIEWELDLERSQQAGLQSTVTSDKEGELYPATAHYYWHAIAQFNGKEYRTTAPIHLTASLNDWPPRGTIFQQEGSTTIAEDPDNPDDEQIEVSDIRVTVNP